MCVCRFVNVCLRWWRTSAKGEESETGVPDSVTPTVKALSPFSRLSLFFLHLSFGFSRLYHYLSLSLSIFPSSLFLFLDIFLSVWPRGSRGICRCELVYEPLSPIDLRGFISNATLVPPVARAVDRESSIIRRFAGSPWFFRSDRIESPGFLSFVVPFPSFGWPRFNEVE